MKIIALLTDFGTADHYVAAMKGAILSRCPRAVLVDITHEVPAYGINGAAFVLWQASRSFPANTIFVAGVDPGVGTNRKLIAVKTDCHVFLAPDNGLLRFVFACAKVKEVREVLPQPSHQISSTFHGRDILAPAAAILAATGRFAKLGPKTHPAHAKPFGTAKPLSPHKIIADIIYRDHFGNCVTGLDNTQFGEWARGFAVQGRVHKKAVHGVYPNFAAIPGNKPGFVQGSTGLVEIACNRGSAADTLGIGPGDIILIGRSRQ